MKLSEKLAEDTWHFVEFYHLNRVDKENIVSDP